LPIVGTGTAICSTLTYFYSSFPPYRSQELAALVSPQPPSTHIPGRSPVLTKKLDQMFVNTMHTAMKLNMHSTTCKEQHLFRAPGKGEVKGAVLPDAICPKKVLMDTTGLTEDAR
jgi:hypothetical protein